MNEPWLYLPVTQEERDLIDEGTFEAGRHGMSRTIQRDEEIWPAELGGEA